MSEFSLAPPCVEVREQNLAELGRRAYRVSDPESATYGKFLTQEEINELTAPLPSDVKAVHEWITSQEGIALSALWHSYYLALKLNQLHTQNSYSCL